MGERRRGGGTPSRPPMPDQRRRKNNEDGQVNGIWESPIKPAYLLPKAQQVDLLLTYPASAEQITYAGYVDKEQTSGGFVAFRLCFIGPHYSSLPIFDPEDLNKLLKSATKIVPSSLSTVPAYRGADHKIRSFELPYLAFDDRIALDTDWRTFRTFVRAYVTRSLAYLLQEYHDGKSSGLFKENQTLEILTVGMPEDILKRMSEEDPDKVVDDLRRTIVRKELSI